VTASPAGVGSGGWRVRAPESIALTTATRTLTVGDAETLAGSAARRLTKAMPDGGCLLLPSADPAAFLIGLMACARSGITAVPWREGLQPLDLITDVVRPDGILRLGDETVIEPVGTPPLKAPRVGGLIMMTSGSTGAPKGVALDLGQVILNGVAAGAAMEVQRCRGWAIDIDMALMSALCHMLMAWQFDLPLHHLGGRADHATRELFRGGGIGFGGSPIQLVRLRGRVDADGGPEMMVSSGDFLSPVMIDDILAAFPAAQVHKLYGLTELAGRFCCMPHDRLMADKAAVGWPLAGFEGRITDAAPGEIGEVEARGPLLMAGYYRAGGIFSPRAAGWFRTGDLGRQGPDGAITLAGRADDVVKVGGEKVDRQSIEQALSDLLVRQEYCVLAVDHPLVGLCPALFIAASPDDVAPPGWSAIVAHLRARLPARFTPGLMYRLEKPLPRLANGKVDREALKMNHSTFTRLR
jgi:acyl-CoA synthetase (AMP-forming)/AMP-acid ligase II